MLKDETREAILENLKKQTQRWREISARQSLFHANANPKKLYIMIIVTGGAGFIGSAIIWALNERGIDDILVVDNLGTSDKWKNLVNRRYAQYMHRDEFMAMLLGVGLQHKPRAIIHMGACSSTTERDAEFLMRNNVRFSQELCRYAVKVGARFIHASSAATYGNGDQGFSDDPGRAHTLKPLNMYGYSKHLFDLWAMRENLLGRIACLKFFNVYGPNEYHKGAMRSVVAKAFAEVKERGRISLFKSDRPDYQDGEQRRDFVYVKDCADIVAWLLDNPDANGLFNVGTGQAGSFNELARAVFAALKLPEAVDYVDMPPELAGKYQYFTQADMGSLQAAGYPVANLRDLQAGVADYVHSYLNQTDIYL